MFFFFFRLLLPCSECMCSSMTRMFWTLRKSLCRWLSSTSWRLHLVSFRLPWARPCRWTPPLILYCFRFVIDFWCWRDLCVAGCGFTQATGEVSLSSWTQTRKRVERKLSFRWDFFLCDRSVMLKIDCVSFPRFRLSMKIWMEVMNNRVWISQLDVSAVSLPLNDNSDITHLWILLCGITVKDTKHLGIASENIAHSSIHLYIYSCVLVSDVHVLLPIEMFKAWYCNSLVNLHCVSLSDREGVVFENGTFSWSKDGPLCLKRYLLLESLQYSSECESFKKPSLSRVFVQNQCEGSLRFAGCCRRSCGQWKILAAFCRARRDWEKKRDCISQGKHTQKFQQNQKVR